MRHRFHLLRDLIGYRYNYRLLLGKAAISSCRDFYEPS